VRSRPPARGAGWSKIGFLVPTRFVSHPDPRVLIDWLRGDIEARRARDPLAPILVLTPNRRLAASLRRALVGGGRSLLGVRVLHLWGLASEIRERIPEGRARLAPDALLRQALGECLRQAGGRLAREAPPGLDGHLLSTFSELREAEVSEADASQLLREVGEERAADTLRVYLRYLRRLRDLAARGWVDRASYVAETVGSAAGWGSGLAAVYLYGAYELIGVHLSLLRALAERARLITLLPLERRGRAWKYGREFAERFLAGGREEIEYLEEPAGGWARGAAGLYEEEPVSPAPPGAGEFELFHAQGVEAELSGVARRILVLHAAGVPLRDIGVVARTLQEYAPHLARVFEVHGIPFSTSATQPLIRFPAPMAFLCLLRALARDFERADLLAFMRSPAARWPEGVRPRPDLLERWSGGAGIRKGLDSWTEDLPAWQREQTREVAERAFEDAEEGRSFRVARERALDEQVEIIRTLGREARAWKECGGLTAQIGFLRALAERWLEGLADGGGGDPAAGALAEIMDEMHAAGEALGEPGRPVEPAFVLDELGGRVTARSLPVRDEDRDGVRVLDGMQARGHAFRALFLCGFNAGRFPLRLGEDPFLPERWRAWLRDNRRRPVPLRDNLDEERLLLALWISAAGHRLFVSYRRADEDGRAEVPSFALREVARLVHGHPDPTPLIGAASAIPVHPERRIAHWKETPGVVAPVEEVLLAALGTGNRAARVRALLGARGERGEALEAALLWMEERGRRWSREEGQVGALPPGVLKESWSPTALEHLARCPLQFFFERVLRLDAIPEPPLEGVFERRDLGRRVHALLQDVYRTLGREALLEPDAGPLRPAEEERCRELVEGVWEDHFGDLGRRVSRRLPVLWREHARRWGAALAAFVVRDLRRWRELGLSLIDLESEGEVRLGDGAAASGPPLILCGKIDRAARLEPESVRITDYKIARDLQPLAVGRQVLRGFRLQAPIYSWIEAGRAGTSPPPRVEVEFLGVGPEHEEDPEAAAVIVAAAELAGWRDGAEETVRALARMAAAGRFPFRHEPEQCGRCDFESACHHRERDARRAVETSPEHADYFDIHDKTLKADTLAKVRAARGKP